MKRILFLANLNPNKFGSLEEYAVFLCGEATRRGHQFCIGFISEPEPEIRRQLEEAGARIIKVNYDDDAALLGEKTWLNISATFALFRTIRENAIDLVHVSFFGLTCPLLVGIYLTGAKIVFTEQSSGAPFRRNLLKRLVLRLAHFFIARRVSTYIGISGYVSKRFFSTHHVAGDKVVTIFNSVNIERFRPRNALEARAELGLPIDRKILCSVAMLIPEKGIHFLLQALARLVDKNGMKDLLLVLVGEGYYRQELERLTGELGIRDHILFLGRRSDVHLLVAAADVVVVPSVWEEAFGIIIAEAMASERPVVASRIGGIPELVEHGKTGFLVTAGDSINLADTLHHVLLNAAELQGVCEAARNKARAEFNHVIQVRKQVDIYEGLLQK